MKEINLVLQSYLNSALVHFNLWIDYHSEFDAIMLIANCEKAAGFVSHKVGKSVSCADVAMYIGFIEAPERPCYEDLIEFITSTQTNHKNV